MQQVIDYMLPKEPISTRCLRLVKRSLLLLFLIHQLKWLVMEIITEFSQGFSYANCFGHATQNIYYCKATLKQQWIYASSLPSPPKLGDLIIILASLMYITSSLASL